MCGLQLDWNSISKIRLDSTSRSKEKNFLWRDIVADADVLSRIFELIQQTKIDNDLIALNEKKAIRVELTGDDKTQVQSLYSKPLSVLSK